MTEGEVDITHWSKNVGLMLDDIDFLYHTVLQASSEPPGYPRIKPSGNNKCLELDPQAESSVPQCCQGHPYPSLKHLHPSCWPHVVTECPKLRKSEREEVSLLSAMMVRRSDSGEHMARVPWLHHNMAEKWKAAYKRHQSRGVAMLCKSSSLTQRCKVDTNPFGNESMTQSPVTKSHLTFQYSTLLTQLQERGPWGTNHPCTPAEWVKRSLPQESRLVCD